MNPPSVHETGTKPAVVSSDVRQRVAARIRAARAAIEGQSTIPRRDPEAPARLSLGEEQLWYLEQFVGGTPTYNICRAWRIRGPLQRAALRCSADDLVARHAGLRTTIAARPQGAVRVEHPANGAAWRAIDRSGCPADARDAEAARLVREAAAEPFDLGRGPLVRFLLVTFAPDDHAFAITMHHIIADGWSLGLMLRELSTLYREHTAGVTAELRSPARDYADFAVWQREQARAGAFARSLDYWEQKLLGAPAMLDLPTDHPRPATPSYRGVVARTVLPMARVRELAALGAPEGASLFVVLLTAFKVLLHRYSGQEDLVVGSPFAGRTQPILDSVVGYFANMLPLRTSVAGDPGFRELLRRVRQTVMEAFDRQDAPFASIVERLRPPVRHAGLNPVFQAAFVLEEQTLVGSPDLAGAHATMIPVDSGTSKFDLSALIIETDAGLDMTIEASADIFEPATASRMLGHYCRLLEGVLADPEAPVSRVPLLTPAERQTIVHQWSGYRTHYPRNATVHGLFAEQARRHPTAIALACGDRTMTYRELNRRAARLARRLRDGGVRPGEFVVIGADRSMEFIIAVLATLKAGAAYVPLDVRHPGSWLARMLEEVRPAAILVAHRYRDAIPPTAVTPLVLDETLLAALAEEGEAEDVEIPTSAAGTAYVMFTSGSTGRPKGTVVPHRAIVRVVRGTHYARFGPNETYLLLANLAFDASTFEIWAALLNGARLAIPTSPQPTLAQIVEEVRRHRVSTLWLTTGLFNLLIDACASELVDVPQILTGGEALSPAHVAKALAALPRTQLINMYGPTENTVFTTSHPITPEHARGHGIPLGRPIANTTVYILDRHREPVPVGVPGELYTGGDGVAQGYLNQPELTDERFVPDPFSHVPGARMYRSGDRCRWRSDGSIEFLGRMDQEIKIRGFRVDLDEIESTLTLLPGVADAAVIARPGASGDKELVAFIVAANGSTLVPAQLREQLATRLPPHMVPGAFNLVAALPLNSNGKIDRRVLASLPSDGSEVASESDRIGPRSDIERRLEAIWRSLLRCERIDVRDDFFALGGHSLLAMRLVHRIQEEFGQSLPLATLLTCSTIERLAARLGMTGPAESSPPVVATGALRGSGPGLPLFFIPGLGGYEFLPAPVARALEGSWPYFDGLQVVGVDRQREPLDDLRAIAADLVRQIRAVQPHGPYNLCGYCYGGVVAFEVARQLEAAGETIPALIIWHGYPVTSPWPRRSVPAVFRAIAQRLRETPPGQRPRMLWDKTVLAARMFGWKLSDEWNRLLGRPRSLIPHNLFFPEEMDPRVVYANLRARGRYQPEPYRGRVFLLMGETERLIYECPPLAGWDGLLLGTVEIFKHPVEHMELVVPPAVEYLAAQTAACLAAAQQGTPARAARGFVAVPSAATPVRVAF